MIPDDPERAVLDRYLTGECTAAEAEQVRRWLARDAAHAARLAELREIREVMASTPIWDAAGMWRGVTEEIARLEPDGVFIDRTEPVGFIGSMTADLDAPSPAAVSPDARSSRALRLPKVVPVARRNRWGWQVAAAVIILLAGLWSSNGSHARWQPGTAAPTAARTFTTQPGQRADVRLADGTQVTLAPGSSLRLAADFGATNAHGVPGAQRRDVYLEGEAYFTVVHDTARPFTVFTGAASIRDIGTVFGVRSYPSDRAVRVAVREGEVLMSGAGRLRAGDVGRLTNDGQAQVARGADVDALLAWTTGRLVYRDTPLEQVIADLHRWYAVDVSLTDASFGKAPFTGTLSHVSPHAAVEEVAGALGLRMTIDGSRIVLEALASRSKPQYRSAPR